jgi:glutaredoxin
MLLTYIFGLERAEIQRFARKFLGLGWRPVAGQAVVRMYSRRACGLCEEARAVIQKVRESSSFDFDEVFIDGDGSLERRYGQRVPVVEVDGVEEFEFTVDPAALERLVARQDAS